MKIGDLDVEKLCIGNQEVEKILLGSIDIPVPSGDTPTPPTPVQDEYYYQISGSSKVLMVTEDDGYSYYASGLTLIPNMYQYIRFWKGNDLIPSSAINYNQPILTSEDNNDVFEDNGAGDEWLLVIVPLSTIRIIPIDDPQDQYEYSTECVVEPINVVIDGTEYPCTTYNGLGSWTFDPSEAGIWGGIYCKDSTVFQVKVFNTYADLNAFTDPDMGGEETHVGSAYTPSYCVDAGFMIDFTDDYYDYASFTVSHLNVPKTDCMQYVWRNGDCIWLDISDDGGEVNLEENGQSIEPGDSVGVLDDAGNLPCGCDVMYVYDENGNMLDTLYSGEWTNNTEDTFNTIQYGSCGFTLITGSGGGGDEPWE